VTLSTYFSLAQALLLLVAAGHHFQSVFSLRLDSLPFLSLRPRLFQVTLQKHLIYYNKQVNDGPAAHHQTSSASEG
jgi:hypothetical protein